MHFEGFSGIGFALIFFCFTGCAFAIALLVLVPIALKGKARQGAGFLYLGLAVIIEPLYFLALGIFTSFFPNSPAVDRLGFLTWLPMPILCFTLAAIGLFFAARKREKLVVAAAVALTVIFASQGLMFLAGS